MQLILSLTLCILVSGCVGVSASNSDQKLDASVVLPAEQLGLAFAAIADHVRPTVLSLFSEKIIKIRPQDIPFPFGELFQRQSGSLHEYRIPQIGAGSGMLLDHQGNILTNYHLVHNVDEVQVQFADQKKIKARVIAKDAKTDVAIVRIEGKNLDHYPTITLGDSDAVHVGDMVIAIGAPFGLAQTVTHGMISAKGRSDVGIADYEDFLQTDAPINPGNSGGPLVNTRGEVIGMNSAIASNLGQSNGVGFAIPSNMIKLMLPKLSKGESISRGELGVGIQNMTEDLARHFGVKEIKGVIISQILKNSAAEKSGLKVEDIIVTYDGKPVDDVRLFRNYVSDSEPGAKIKVGLIRDKKNLTLTATIAKQMNDPESTAMNENENTHDQDNEAGRLGLSVETLSKELAFQLRIQEQYGVVIVDLDQTSSAVLAGLQIGDVITQVNHRKIKSAEEFKKIISQNKSDNILLLVKRRDASMFVSMRVE